MAKFLFAVVPIQGHMSPGLPIARTLVKMGHEVLWYSTSKYREKIEETGARFTKVQAAKDYDDNDLNAAFPGRNNQKGLKQLKFDLKHVFFDQMIDYDVDLRAVLRKFPADVVVMDAAFTGMAAMKMKGESPKTAVYSVMPLTLSSRDTAPFGFGIQPSSTAFGQVRNKLTNMLVQKVVFADVQKYLNDLLKEMGAPSLESFFMDGAVYRNDLFLQGTSPSFEYPRSDLPENVTFVGPFLPDKPKNYAVPSWWKELQGDRPVIHVTQGTVATEDFNQLLIPTIQALAAEDVLVVVTTGNKPLDHLNIPLPANVRLEEFIPHHVLLPYVDVMITNTGYGGVQMAICYGVPLVVAGKTEDKPEVCARVEWAGIGIDLKTNTPSREKISRAIKQVLHQPTYKERVGSLSREFGSYNALQNAADKLVELSSSRRQNKEYQTI